MLVEKKYDKDLEVMLFELPVYKKSSYKQRVHKIFKNKAVKILIKFFIQGM